MVIRTGDKTNSKAYGSNNPGKSGDVLPLPRRRQWPRTDGFIDKKTDLPSIFVLAEDDPFITKYEHYDRYKARTFSCSAKFSDQNGLWRLDKTLCPYCQKGDSAKARVYLVVSFEEPEMVTNEDGTERPETFLFGVPPTAWRSLMALHPDTTEWKGLRISATTMETFIGGRQVNTIGFLPVENTDDSENEKKEEKKEVKEEDKKEEKKPAKKKSTKKSTKAGNTKLDKEILAGLVEKYKDLKPLGLPKDQIRTMIATALERDNIDSEYVDAIMTALYD